MALSLLVILFMSIPAESLMQHVKKAKTSFLYPALAILLVRHVISAMRWQMLLKIRNIEIALLSLVRYNYIGLFINNFLPTSCGGDVARIGYIQKKHDAPFLIASSSVIIERILGLASLSCIALLATPWDLIPSMEFRGTTAQISLFLAVMVPLVAAALFFLFPSPNGEQKNKESKLSTIINTFTLYRQEPLSLFVSVIYSFLFQLLTIYGVYLIYRSITDHITIVGFLFAIPLATLISMVPISINGIGIREGALVVLLKLFGVSTNTAVSGALLWLGLNIIQSLLGGIFILKFRNVKNNPP